MTNSWYFEKQVTNFKRNTNRPKCVGAITDDVKLLNVTLVKWHYAAKRDKVAK